MDFFDLYRYFLVLIVPGLIGAVAYTFAYKCKTDCNICLALILDLLTFIIMITGLYYCKNVTTVAALLTEFTCLSFTRKFALLSIFISVFLGATLGLINRLCHCKKH